MSARESIWKIAILHGGGVRGSHKRGSETRTQIHTREERKWCVEH